MKLTNKEVVSYCLSEVMKSKLDPYNKQQRKQYNNIVEDSNQLIDYLIQEGFLEDSKELQYTLLDYFDIKFLSERPDYK